MTEFTFGNVKVASRMENFTAEVAAKYVHYVKSHVSNVDWDNSINIFIEVVPCADGSVDVNYSIDGKKFERIRRITGYLSGTLSTWNNAKRAEERDRVKHLKVSL